MSRRDEPGPPWAERGTERYRGGAEVPAVWRARAGSGAEREWDVCGDNATTARRSGITPRSTACAAGVRVRRRSELTARKIDEPPSNIVPLWRRSSLRARSPTLPRRAREEMRRAAGLPL